MNIQRIGFIGTGVMGSGMIRNLQKAGYPVNINTRTKTKAEKLIQEGCRWFDSQAELAAQSDVVITMVGYPQDVEPSISVTRASFAANRAVSSST